MNIIDKIKQAFIKKDVLEGISFKYGNDEAFNFLGVADLLKADFLKNTKRTGEITSLCFNDKRTKLVNLNGRNYWCIQILDADILESGVDEECVETSFTTEDMLFLRCLIDVETGEYVYYPYESRA